MKKTPIVQAMATLMMALILTLPVCFADTLSLEYDANGNLVTGDGIYRVYNSLNQLSKVYNGSSEEGTLLETFVYHPTEERVLMKKSYHENGSVKETVIYLSKSFVHVKNQSGRFNITYIYHNGQLVGQQTAQGATTNKVYIHGDHLGSSSVVTNEASEVIENSSFSPFGLPLTGGTETRYGYEGKEYDSVVGDTDFHFRKYKPEWGIFTQPDTLIQNVYDPQSLNRFMFERGNPYKYVDPDGHFVDLVLYAYVAWKIWGLALVIAPLLEKTVKGEIEFSDFLSLAAAEGGASLVPGLGDYMTAINTVHLIKNAFDGRIKDQKTNEEAPKDNFKGDYLLDPAEGDTSSSSDKIINPLPSEVTKTDIPPLPQKTDDADTASTVTHSSKSSSGGTSSAISYIGKSVTLNKGQTYNWGSGWARSNRVTITVKFLGKIQH